MTLAFKCGESDMWLSTNYMRKFSYDLCTIKSYYNKKNSNCILELLSWAIFVCKVFTISYKIYNFLNVSILKYSWQLIFFKITNLTPFASNYNL